MNQNQNEHKDKNIKEDGLPDVAEMIRDKKTLVVIALVAVIAAISGTYWLQFPEKKKAPQIAETYSVINQPQAMIENVKPEVRKQIETTKKNDASKPAISAEAMQQQMAYLEEQKRVLQQRLSAPLMIVNNNVASSVNRTDGKQATESLDPNVQFMNQVSAQNTDVAVATKIAPLNRVIAEGNFIHAILESATDSDLPGYLRATVSVPVYSEDGSEVLIPVGSRLIGQYKSSLQQGQSRIYVVWTRLITTNGDSIQLGSPGIDSLGVAGISADQINRHFWARFGQASLLSLIGAGAANLGVNSDDQNNSAATYREAIASSFSKSANQSLQQDGQIATTLKTHQGKPIMVFVAKDLHFENVLKKLSHQLNIF